MRLSTKLSFLGSTVTILSSSVCTVGIFVLCDSSSLIASGTPLAYFGRGSLMLVNICSIKLFVAAAGSESPPCSTSFELEPGLPSAKEKLVPEKFVPGVDAAVPGVMRASFLLPSPAAS